MELTRKNVKRIVENRLCADLNNRISYVNCVYRWTMYNSLPLHHLNLFFPFHLVREEISEIYRYIIFNNIFLNFTKSSVLDLFPAMYIPSEKKNEEEALHISKLTFLFIRKEALNKKEINIILKFLFFCIFHNNIRNRKPSVSKLTLCLE